MFLIIFQLLKCKVIHRLLKLKKKTMHNYLEYYYDFLSQPSRALYILLKQSGSKFVAKEIDLLAGRSNQRNILNKTIIQISHKNS